MAYSEQVLDHYENPRNVGNMDSEDVNVGTGMVGAPACGDVMRLQIRVNELYHPLKYIALCLPRMQYRQLSKTIRVNINDKCSGVVYGLEHLF